MRAIDADALQLAIVEEGQANKRKKYIIGDIWELTGAEIREVINSQPTIQQPRRGQWIMSNVGDTFMTDAPKIIYCSSCNVCAPYATNYCPMCGADMRGEQDG